VPLVDVTARLHPPYPTPSASVHQKQVCSVMAEKLRCAGTPEAISVAIAGPCDTQLDEHAPPLRSRLRPRRTWRMVSASPNIAV